MSGPVTADLAGLDVDPHAATAPFEQVVGAITARIEAGTLTPGTRLPPVRRLATDLALAANTVARAYRELEQRGLIETRGRGGSFVAGAGVDREARAAASAYADRIRALGLDATAALELVRRALDA